MSLSITVLEIGVTYILPFVLYWLQLWSLTSNRCCFKANWYRYKKKTRDQAREKLKKAPVYPAGQQSFDQTFEALQLSGARPKSLAKWHSSYEKLTYDEFADVCKRLPLDSEEFKSAKSQIYNTYESKAIVSCPQSPAASNQ